MSDKKKIIKEKLFENFQPFFLEVVDQTHLHKDHIGYTKPKDTHFKITVVSDAFLEKSLIDRHRKVYGALKEDISGGIHAVTIQAYTEKEAKTAGVI
ncbi:hypothetical protein AB834_05175 [PVC group bacterium (ex Bugula neritina AB1)]|nr:hypothetical protein AB834_05175 [PVC group bacterium (ex Bugula neritina AB1)]